MKVYDAPTMTEPVGCIRYVKPRSRVLEFGPGTGFATRYMKEKLGCRVTCVEYSPEAAEVAERYAEQMIVADIETDGWQRQLAGRYDYVVFGDVLEHLRDPRRAVERVLDCLAPQGAVLTSVPNIGHNAILLGLRKGRFGYRDFGLLDNTHIHFFTRASLSELFGGLGLSSVSSDDNVVRPCLSEFGVHYWEQPLFSLCILRNRDGHVYQFVDEWRLSERPILSRVPRRLSPLRALAELLYDGAHFVFKLLPDTLQQRIKGGF